jgi:hypothetical protein
MVGERSAQADDAVTLGRQAKGHWLLRDALSSILGGWLQPPAAFSLVRDTHSRLLSTNASPVATRYRRGGIRELITPTSGWNRSLLTPGHTHTLTERNTPWGNGAAPG